MKIKVDVFRSEEARESNTALCQTFDLTINAPYPFPAVGAEFRKVFKEAARDKILRQLHGEVVSQDSLHSNIECDTENWDCKEKLFTVQLKFSGRHAVLDYKNETLTDYSRPNEVFYLKGTIE